MWICVCGYFPLKMMATSSAYATTLQTPPSRIRSSLFTAIFHRRGYSTPPCGTPLFTSLVWVEVASVAVTILLISNLWISLTIGVSTPSSVTYSVIAVGSTLLKAHSLQVAMGIPTSSSPGRRGLMVPCLANSSAMQLPTMSRCPGAHIRLIVN